MKKILILTAAYGEGHNAAARGLLAGFAQTGRAEAKIVDSFADGMGAAYDRSRKAYLQLIDRHPGIWAGIYGIIDRTPIIHLLVPTLKPVAQAFARTIEEEKPDAVISTYPAYHYFLDRMPQRTFPRYMVVTDSITVNSVWHRCRSDLFFLPNDDTARTVRRAGVAESLLQTLGFPVDPVFAATRENRLPPGSGEPLRVLFMINAAKARAPGLVERLLQIEGIRLTVTAGRDENLKSAVEAVARRKGAAVDVYGWTSQMPQLLMEHHLLIGKAGGAAVQETLAARTPMIVTQVVPGQEEGNARLLVENHCGAICETDEAVATRIESLVADGAREWIEWEANAGRLSRPDASVRMAAAVLDAIGG